MRRIVSLAANLCTLASAAGGQTAAEAGDRVAAAAYEALRGYGDLEARVVITQRSRRGDERQWIVRMLALARASEERSIVVFEEPRDVRGTALLSRSSSGVSDEQWLYLPAVGRAKRIASHGRSASFMGTEFSYEDIASPQVQDFVHRLVREDVMDGVGAYVVERAPRDADSQYRRHVLWLDRDAYRPLRIEFYDRGDVLLKTLSYMGYRQHGGRFWRADRMEMVNHRTGAVTTLTWTDYRFNTGLLERDFEPVALAHVR